jgi:hypothetical protein
VLLFFRVAAVSHEHQNKPDKQRYINNMDVPERDADQDRVLSDLLSRDDNERARQLAQQRVENNRVDRLQSEQLFHR